MEHSLKRVRCSNATPIEDITTYIRDISESVKLLGETHGALLKVNKAMVTYMHKSKVDTSYEPESTSTMEEPSLAINSED